MSTTVTAAESLAILTEALGIGAVASVHYGPIARGRAVIVWWVRLEDGRVFVIGTNATLRNTDALGRLVGHPGPIKRSHANRIAVALRFALKHTDPALRHASADSVRTMSDAVTDHGGE